MLTPWNSSSACLLARSDRIGGDHLDLLNRGHVIPLGLHAPYAMRYAPCPLPSALCLPREIHISDSAAYFTGAPCLPLYRGSAIL